MIVATLSCYYKMKRPICTPGAQRVKLPFLAQIAQETLPSEPYWVRVQPVFIQVPSPVFLDICRLNLSFPQVLDAVAVLFHLLTQVPTLLSGDLLTSHNEISQALLIPRPLTPNMVKDASP